MGAGLHHPAPCVHAGGTSPTGSQGLPSEGPRLSLLRPSPSTLRVTCDPGKQETMDTQNKIQEGPDPAKATSLRLRGEIGASPSSPQNVLGFRLWGMRGLPGVVPFSGSVLGGRAHGRHVSRPLPLFWFTETAGFRLKTRALPAASTATCRPEFGGGRLPEANSVSVWGF